MGHKTEGRKEIAVQFIGQQLLHMLEEPLVL